jgi:hypothetical protein
MIKIVVSNVDGHLRLRTPYPVRSVKLSGSTDIGEPIGPPVPTA